jgi:hypothetical protein
MSLVNQQVFLTPGASFTLTAAKVSLGPQADNTDAMVTFDQSAAMLGNRDSLHGGVQVGTIEVDVMPNVPMDFNVYMDEASGKFYYNHQVVMRDGVTPH